MTFYLNEWEDRHPYRNDEHLPSDSHSLFQEIVKKLKKMSWGTKQRQGITAWPVLLNIFFLPGWIEPTLHCQLSKEIWGHHWDVIIYTDYEIIALSYHTTYSPPNPSQIHTSLAYDFITIVNVTLYNYYYALIICVRLLFYTWWPLHFSILLTIKTVDLPCSTTTPKCPASPHSSGWATPE